MKPHILWSFIWIQIVCKVFEPLPAVSQPIVDYIANHVTARIEVVDNLHKVDNFMTVRLNLTNNHNMNIMAGNWRIHLYSLYGFKVETLDCGLRVGHVNGGLFFVTPSSTSFNGLRTGETLTCVLRNHWWSVTRTDQMPNWYVSAKGTKPRTIANTADESLSFVGKFDKPAQWKRTQQDVYNPYTTEERYKMYQREHTRKDLWYIVPTPKNISNFDRNKHIRLTKMMVHYSKTFDFESKFLADKLGLRLVQSGCNTECIKFTKEYMNNQKEAYVLDIDPPHSVTIKAEDARGALHGVQTLISIFEGSNDTPIPKRKISDRPRFEYRGIMIDVARNFKPKEWMFKLLDIMSMYKLNKLHFHLSDDEGWRLEIPGLPELTQVGGRRSHTDDLNACVVPALGSGSDSSTSGSGYYTIKDYREILQYAADRHIDVIPEIEMPGHASAAITSMFFREAKIAKLKAAGELNIPYSYALSDADMDSSVESVQRWRVNAINPCLNSSYNFVEAVLNGLINLHRGVMPLEIFHVGGDEVAEGVWSHSEHCRDKRGSDGVLDEHKLQKEFVKRVGLILASKNVSMAAWEDGMYAHGRPNPITDYKSPVYAYPWSSKWGTENAKRSSEFADAGYKVILPLSTHLYFDHPYEPDPEERGLYWSTRFIDTKKVFGFMPRHVWWNADVDRMGQPADLQKICNNKPCPEPRKPENIIGMQATLFSETVRNEDHFHYMIFPRLLALAERAWHSAPWEDIEDKTSRDAKRKADWEDFASTLGYKEFTRLEKRNVKYRVPPPGGILSGDQLRVNTLYPNHDVDYSLDAGDTWQTAHMRQLNNVPPGTESVLLRSMSPHLKRVSRVVEAKPSPVSLSDAPNVTSSITTLIAAFFITNVFLCNVL